MDSAFSLARVAASSGRSADGLETVGLDPQFMRALALNQGDVVRFLHHSSLFIAG